MTIDAVTLYAAKVAATTTTGVAVAAWGTLAQTGAASASFIALGVTTIAAGVFKLLTDHTVAKAARDGYEARIAELVADNRRLELEVDTHRNARHAVELEAMRKGIELPALHDIPLDRPAPPPTD